MALGEASKQVIVVLNIVVNAAIAIIKKTLSPIELVYRLISCFANSPPEFEKTSPLPYITKAPKDRKLKPKIKVVNYPVLKSKRASLILKLSSFLVFSNVHIDCHIDTSIGAGIQPINAARKIIPTSVLGKT